MDRREFLKTTLAGPVGIGLVNYAESFAKSYYTLGGVMDKKKIAAIITTYFQGSHADVIVTKFMKGFPTDEGLKEPKVELASIYLDQIHEKDVGQKLAAEHNVPIYQSIRAALTLGGDKLAVDGVLLIGEHGDYPSNEKGQHMFPRRYFFEQICGVFASSGKSVPVFNDKHLSYNWDDALWMYERAQELDVPLMAGSSVPLAWRNPQLEFELGTPVQESLVISYSGVEIYGIHALENLQCMVERRSGGETGIAAVQCLEGEDVWSARSEGLWSRKLEEAASSAIVDKPPGDMREHCPNPAAFMIEYRDGLKATILMLLGYIYDFAFAGLSDGEVLATEFYIQNQPPHGNFSYLSLNIQEMFLTGKPQYRVERTLLTTGAIDSVMNSRYQGYSRVETPHLDVVYGPSEKQIIRPTGTRPSGATLDPWPPEG